MIKRLLPLTLILALLASTGVASAETRKFSGALTGSPGGKVTFTFSYKRSKTTKKVIRSSKRVSNVKVTGLRSQCGTVLSHNYKGKYRFQGPSFLGNSITDDGTWDVSASIPSNSKKATGSLGYTNPDCNANARFVAKSK